MRKLSDDKKKYLIDAKYLVLFTNDLEGKNDRIFIGNFGIHKFLASALPYGSSILKMSNLFALGNFFIINLRLQLALN